MASRLEYVENNTFFNKAPIKKYDWKLDNFK